MDRLYPLLEAFDEADTKAERAAVEAKLFDTYSKLGAILVTDMSGFSRITQARGIVHYMNMIRRMRLAMAKAVAELDGQLVKFVGDNAFASFKEPAQAAQAVRLAQERLADEDRDRDDDSKVLLAGGIDFGDYLAIAGDDFFGDPVNVASKLGEDLATGGELWLSERAYQGIPQSFLDEWEASWQVTKVTVSGVKLKTYQTRI
ncbi:MAG: adenylate/guanylate cyclase domain-containing protein [Magnetovibrionaceae bacterium]